MLPIEENYCRQIHYLASLAVCIEAISHQHHRPPPRLPSPVSFSPLTPPARLSYHHCCLSLRDLLLGLLTNPPCYLVESILLILPPLPFVSLALYTKYNSVLLVASPYPIAAVRRWQTRVSILIALLRITQTNPFISRSIFATTTDSVGYRQAGKGILLAEFVNCERSLPRPPP